MNAPRGESNRGTPPAPWVSRGGVDGPSGHGSPPTAPAGAGGESEGIPGRESRTLGGTTDRTTGWAEPGAGGRESTSLQDPSLPTPDRAPVWDAIWAQKGLLSKLISAAREGMHALHRGVLLRHLNPDASVLELGCGPATLTLSVAPRIRSLVGLDISPEALRQATANARALGIMNATFLEGDCRAVPFTNTFTVVWSAGLIEHFFEHDIDVVREHLRAASPSGVAIMSVPSTFSAHHLHYLLTRPRVLRWLWPWSNLRHFQRFYAPWQLRRLGQATGFPFQVFYLPPAPLGFLLGILVLEIHKEVPEARSPRTS